MIKNQVLIGITLLLHSCAPIEKKMGLTEDNIIEEVAEDFIEEELGVEVDLTPDTLEKE